MAPQSAAWHLLCKPGIREAMNDFRSIGVPAEGCGSDIGRKALWVIRGLSLPAIVKPH